jgi:pilus assembly protein CpaE
MLRGTGKEPELASLLIAPDRDLARQLTATLSEARTFQILSELKSYPQEQTLDLRLRQIQPEVVLLDLATDFEAASALLRQIASMVPPVHVIGLHRSNDADVLIRSLRAGAHEFLHAPFDVAAQREAVARIRRLREPEAGAAPESGKVVVFSSTKPGSGASTLAVQTAFSLKRLTGKRILLADLDVMGGSVGFALKLNSAYSLMDALERSDQLDPGLWSTLITSTGGVDVLPAPEVAMTDGVEPTRLHEVIEYARMLYDWVVVDLPTIFHRISLFALTEADQSFLVSTAELPSLHLARRAVGLLGQLGFGRDRFQMVINRLSNREGISATDMEKILNCPVFSTFPNDYYALHRVVTRAESLPPDSDLGRAIESVSSRLAGLIQKDKRQGSSLLEQKPALSQT